MAPPDFAGTKNDSKKYVSYTTNHIKHFLLQQYTPPPRLPANGKSNSVQIQQKPGVQFKLPLGIKPGGGSLKRKNKQAKTG
jgi:hypothetical protein